MRLVKATIPPLITARGKKRKQMSVTIQRREIHVLQESEKRNTLQEKWSLATTLSRRYSP
jgi:hypothetical protein